MEELESPQGISCHSLPTFYFRITIVVFFFWGGGLPPVTIGSFSKYSQLHSISRAVGVLRVFLIC